MAEAVKPEPTRDQKRAQSVFDAVTAVKNRNTFVEEYGRQCLRLPILIQQDGLCLTLAFLEAKAKPQKPYFRQVVDDLQRILGADAEKIRKADAVTYQRLSREALRTALWFKRYAEAVLDVSLESDPGGH
ncbi:MAG: type III-B CRISPR module-associated protein Cmr5 [Acidobacteria bacterium]|nr:type III-B CRISPR module-associated protein Cmr5 [Acidobacteriota bacterium]